MTSIPAGRAMSALLRYSPLLLLALGPLAAVGGNLGVRRLVGDVDGAAEVAEVGHVGHGDLGDLIVESMPRCTAQVRAMIDAYDRDFGNGEGEAFFLGPYLDVLPSAVSKWAEMP